MKKTQILFAIFATSMLIASCGKKEPAKEPIDTGTDTAPVETPTTFPFEDFNEYLEETGVEIPSFQSTAEWEFYIDDGSTGYTPSAVAYTEDDDFTVENEYLEAVKATNWVCNNDKMYNYDDYGYLYDDPTGQVEIQFYTIEGYFQLIANFLDGSAPEKYVGDAWNADYINAAFTDFPEWVDILPEYEFAEGNEDGYFEFHNETELNGGEPYLQLYVCGTTEEEAEAWFDKIYEECKIFGYTELMGDDEKNCPNDNLCETIYDAFVYHGYEIAFDETTDLMFLFDNYLDDEEEPYFGVEIMYWPD